MNALDELVRMVLDIAEENITVYDHGPVDAPRVPPNGRTVVVVRGRVIERKIDVDIQTVIRRLVTEP